jgi:hypothetical protein
MNATTTNTSNGSAAGTRTRVVLTDCEKFAVWQQLEKDREWIKRTRPTRVALVRRYQKLTELDKFNDNHLAAALGALKIKLEGKRSATRDELADRVATLELVLLDVCQAIGKPGLARTLGDAQKMLGLENEGTP